MKGLNIVVNTVQKDGRVKVPSPFLKVMGWKPGVTVAMQVIHSALIIKTAARPASPHRVTALAPLRGCLKHIRWDAVRHDVQTQWSEWRTRPSA